MKKYLTLFMIFSGLSLFASDEEMYREGLDLATEKHVFETVNPSGTILEYQGTNLEESRYLDGFSILSEDAKRALYKEGETPGALLLEVTQDKPHFKVDANDPLIKDANEVIQNPEATIQAEIEENSEQESLKKTLHTCVEGGDPYTATCTRDLSVEVIQKYKEYLNTTIYGVRNRETFVSGNPQYTCKYVAHYGHDGRYNLTVKDETIVEAKWYYFDRCNPYWHTVIKHYKFFKGFKGEVQTPITQEEYESKTLSPSDIREQWVSHCDALEKLVDEGQCTYAEKKCVGGPGTRLIDGHPVFKQCWQEQLTYRCERPVQNTCTPLRLKWCSQISSKCLEKQGNTCVLYEQTFECMDQQCSSKKIKLKGTSTPYCLDGSCSTFQYAPNQDMAEALTKLTIFKDMQGQIEAKANFIFKGEAKSWFIPSYAILSLMLVPKTTVNIVDEVDPYFRSDRIDNIPVGIAVIASTASTISRALTEEIESVFPTPDSLRYVKAGPVFGARLAAQARYVRIKDPIVRSNVKNFMRQCFFWPFVASNLKGLKHEALTTNDILSFIKSNLHPWLGVYWKSPDGSQSFMDCKVAVSQVAEVMSIEGDKGLLHLASTLFGGDPDTSEVSSNLKHMMKDAWSSLAHQTSEASSSVGQQMLVNAYREAVDDTREEMGQDRLSPELLSYSATRTLAQQSMSFLVKGTVATSFMPMVQAILFGMLLIIFVLIIPLCFVPGGLSLLALWVRLIFWVQSFPVFSAILSALTTMLHQRMNDGVFRTVGSGFSVETTTALADAAFDAACLMSGLQLSVPFIAYAFISKSGYALTNVASMMSSGVEGIASKIGGEMADGNISFDNQSFHNQTVSGRQIAQQQLGSNFNYGSSLNDGKMTLSTSMDGLQTVSVMQSTLTSNVSSNDNLQASINDNYTKSQQLMENASHSFMKSTSDTASQLLNFTNRLSHGVGLTEGLSTNTSTEMRQNAEQTLGDLKSFSKKHNISEQTAAEMAVRANAGVSFDGGLPGKALGAISGLKGKIGIDGNAGISASAQNQEIYDAMKNSDEGRRLSHGIGELLQHAKQHGTNITDQSAQDAAKSFQGAYATMTQASEQFQKAYTQSENWSHAKSLSDTKGISLTTNENEAYLNYVASKRFGGDIMQAAHYVENNPHNVEQLEFMKDRQAAFASWVSDAKHVLSDGEIQNYLGSMNQQVGQRSIADTRQHIQDANFKSEETLLKDVDLIGAEVDKSRGSNASEIRSLRYELEQQQENQTLAHQVKNDSSNIVRMGKNALGVNK